ncbi:GIY-YIG nuclease family protein [Brasilonema sp. UFV-L1]|uniref:GIY-YIG nuclease family protein n=1 Tax=Brasilonema sp. UFV-L1 TaxID=2234130 RepID=UPI00145EAB7F|nr:GIY-YIG nuclease family protein [Brasilonema sp. UFV-L1]NMG11357.1 GIY-YIG nuclease family protein [Brasilonema sp. UFV-L1]
MNYVYRDDHVPGFIYLIESIGYHGIIPGKFPGVKRCKIGLTRSLDLRLDNLESSQPPCDYVILKSIYVSDMKTVETLLHKEFKEFNIKLKKSREWFDFAPWELIRVRMAFSRHHRKYGLVEARTRTLNLNLSIASAKPLLYGAIGFVLFVMLGSAVISAASNELQSTPSQTEVQTR